MVRFLAIGFAGLVAVISAKPWLSIAGAFEHTCGIDAASTVFCWGENQYGQNGDGSSYEPSPVVSGVP